MSEVQDAAVLAAAFNDHHLEHWVGFDPRFRLAVVVPPKDPRLAVDEIRRHADTPGVAAIWLVLTDRLLGSPYYDSILAAAHESGLAIVCHPNVNMGAMPGSPPLAGGAAVTQAERYSALPTIAMANVASLVWEGTFERYPGLKVVFAEFGWSWLSYLTWKMDAGWKTARRTMPWVKRPPSEYLREHVLLTTGPGRELPSGDAEQRVVGMIQGDRMLAFGSDYPHWQADAPADILTSLPPEVRARVLHENAVETLGARMLPASAAQVER
jgi:predicted TIM-barrel fold metal-dependent hydrolase